jgi:hypothetical protein
MKRVMVIPALLISIFSFAQVSTYMSPTYTYLAMTSSGRLWDACNGCPNVFEIDATGRTVNFVSGLPEQLFFEDMLSDGTNVWLTFPGHSSYFKINSATLVSTTFTGLSAPRQLAFDGTNIWIVSGTTINKIDIATGAVISSIDAGVPLEDILFDNDHNLWALTTAGMLLKFTPGSILPVAILSIGTDPRSLGYDGSTIWVSYGSGITRIDALTNAPVGNYATASSPASRFAWDGRNMWMLIPGGFARLNNSGSPVDSYFFPNAASDTLNARGTDILFNGSEIMAVNNMFLMTVPVGALAPLPVKFSVLNSVCSGGSVVINWKADGQQVKQFDVQRSNNGTTWETFETVKYNNAGSYRVVDRHVSSEAFYRIREIDNDDRVYVSTIFKSSCSLPANFSIFPNPARNQTTINLAANEPGRGSIKVYNSDGRLVKSFQREIMKGQNQIPLDLSQLQAGMYQVITSWGANVKSANFVKQ